MELKIINYLVLVFGILLRELCNGHLSWMLGSVDKAWHPNVPVWSYFMAFNLLVIACCAVSCHCCCCMIICANFAWQLEGLIITTSKLNYNFCHVSLHVGQCLVTKAIFSPAACLLPESLLLGSLFWLVSIVFLFLVPPLPQPRKVASRLERGLAHQEIMVAGRVANERVETILGLDFFIMRRRWRGSRSRMKFCLFPLHAVYA